MKKMMISALTVYSFTLLLSISACKPNGDDNSTDAVNSIDQVAIDSINNVPPIDTTSMRDTFNNHSHDTTVPPL